MARGSVTLKRIALQTAVNDASARDITAAARNKALLEDAQQALTLLRVAKERAQAASDAQKHEMSLIREREALARVQRELAEVQAHRDAARANFAAELAAKDEAAQARQQLAAERELARFDEVEREAVRAGVSAEVAAAAGAVEAASITIHRGRGAE